VLHSGGGKCISVSKEKEKAKPSLAFCDAKSL